jgi:hypothetical protein
VAGGGQAHRGLIAAYTGRVSSELRPKGTGHDQRTCRFLGPNPSFDRSSIPAGKDRARLPLFLCHAKEPPVISTMVKCKYCRENNLLYEPREAGEQPPQGARGA